MTRYIEIEGKSALVAIAMRVSFLKKLFITWAVTLELQNLRAQRGYSTLMVEDEIDTFEYWLELLQKKGATVGEIVWDENYSLYTITIEAPEEEF